MKSTKEKFKVGDFVKISIDSQYYGKSKLNPKEIVGMIINTDLEDEHNYIHVRWSDTRSTNSYNTEDLNRIYYNEK